MTIVFTNTTITHT